MSDAALTDAAQSDASFTPVTVHVPPRTVVHASPAPTASAANCIIAGGAPVSGERRRSEGEGQRLPGLARASATETATATGGGGAME